MSVALSDAPAQSTSTLVRAWPAAGDWSPDFAAEIEKQSVYVSPHIRRMVVSTRSGFQ